MTLCCCWVGVLGVAGVESPASLRALDGAAAATPESVPEGGAATGAGVPPSSEMAGASAGVSRVVGSGASGAGVVRDRPIHDALHPLSTPVMINPTERPSSANLSRDPCCGNCTWYREIRPRGGHVVGTGGKCDHGWMLYHLLDGNIGHDPSIRLIVNERDHCCHWERQKGDRQ